MWRLDLGLWEASAVWLRDMWSRQKFYVMVPLFFLFPVQYSNPLRLVSYWPIWDEALKKKIQKTRSFHLF